MLYLYLVKICIMQQKNVEDEKSSPLLCAVVISEILLPMSSKYTFKLMLCVKHMK